MCHDMGGNFGTRNLFYPEYALLAWAARRIRRPVKWTCERSESFLSDYQGRDLTAEAELALDAYGNFLAVRGSNLSNLGGHAVAFGPLQKGLGLMSNVYRHSGRLFPRSGRGHQHGFDHALSQLRPARGDFCRRAAGRSGGRQARVDPAALRRRNMIPASGATLRQPARRNLRQRRLPAGDGHRPGASRLGRLSGAPRRMRADAAKMRGIGIANYVEITSGAPRERGEITVLPEGKVELVMGTMASGQGHETSFAQLVTRMARRAVRQHRIRRS